MAHHGCCITDLPLVCCVNRSQLHLATTGSSRQQSQPSSGELVSGPSNDCQVSHLVRCVTLRGCSVVHVEVFLKYTSYWQICLASSRLQPACRACSHVAGAKVCWMQGCFGFALNGLRHSWDFELALCWIDNYIPQSLLYSWNYHAQVNHCLTANTTTQNWKIPDIHK